MSESDAKKISSPKQDSLDQFSTYEDYLDAQLTEADLFYLEDEELARQLVELGYRGMGDTLHREEFEAQKISERDRYAEKISASRPLASAGKSFAQLPVLEALASREELVRSGKLSCVLFIRDRNARGQEISGYIDYAARLKSEPFEPYFEQKKKLLPTSNDLSFYNWDTQKSSSNSSANFQVIADSETGLLFKNKRDRKVLNVDPKANPGDHSSRTEIPTKDYLQVVIFDHMTRRKT
ncbi:hypothetical protein ABG067_000166 [Albugo candida]